MGPIFTAPSLAASSFLHNNKCLMMERRESRASAWPPASWHFWPFLPLDNLSVFCLSWIFNIATCFDLMGNFLLCNYVQWKSSWRHKLAVYEASTACRIRDQDYDGTVVVLSGKLEYLLFRWNSIRDWTKVSSQDADFQVNQVNSTWGMHEALRDFSCPSTWIGENISHFSSRNTAEMFRCFTGITS